MWSYYWVYSFFSLDLLSTYNSLHSAIFAQWSILELPIYAEGHSTTLYVPTSSLDHARLLSYFLCLTLPSTLPFASEKRKDEGKERKKVHSLRIFRTNEIFRLLNHYFSHICKVLPRIPYWMDGLQKDLRILPGFLNTVDVSISQSLSTFRFRFVHCRSFGTQSSEESSDQTCGRRQVFFHFLHSHFPYRSCQWFSNQSQRTKLEKEAKSCHRKWMGHTRQRSTYKVSNLLSLKNLSFRVPF